MGRKVIEWCRATSFGVPIGPWRFGRRDARRDLIAEGLGSYDEDGCFFTTVPGGMDVRQEWVNFDEAVELAETMKRRYAAEHLKSRSVSDMDRRMSRICRARNKPGRLAFELLKGGLAISIQNNVKPTRK